MSICDGCKHNKKVLNKAHSFMGPVYDQTCTGPPGPFVAKTRPLKCIHKDPTLLFRITRMVRRSVGSGDAE